MTQNTKDFLGKWAELLIVVVIVLVLMAVLAFSRAHAPETSLTPANTTIATSTLMASSTALGATISGEPHIPISPTNTSFMSPEWSLKFTLRPEWNVNQILNGNVLQGTGSLHQMIISGSKTVIFVSQNEAIGLSNDLVSTSATRMIAGQNVEVKTYLKPSAQFAFYQLFTIKESDASYSFLIKSADADMAVANKFINSISKK
jgi:hypothetical protein